MRWVFHWGVGVDLGQSIFAVDDKRCYFGEWGYGASKSGVVAFFHVRILSRVRFPLHDHMRENWHWSTAQVLLRFMILQGLLTIGLLGVLFKLR